MTDEKTLKYETFTCYSYGMSFFKRDAKKYILIYAGIMLVFASVRHSNAKYWENFQVASRIRANI